MKAFLALIFILTFCDCSAQTRLDKMISQLRQADFGAIYQVKDSLVNRGAEAMPKLIGMLKDTSFVRLGNTGDLIYPGADKFYGHGGVIRYDIDWVSVRAAWIIEEITFQSFGYHDLSISEEKLMKFHKQDYKSYFQSGYHKIDFKNKTPRQRLIAYRVVLADSVAKWWNVNASNWTRLQGIKDALASSNEERQALALHYLRFEETTCKGLNLETYQKELEPLVQRIKNSKSEQARQAKMLLDDNEFYWLRGKNKSRS